MLTLRAGLVAAIAVALSLAACSNTGAAPPSSTSPPPPTSGTAPGVDFPDTNGYLEGDHSTFYRSGVQYGGFSFRTPDGQQCTSNSYPDVERTRMQCWGPRPDRGAGLWVVTAESAAPAKIRQLPATDRQPGAEVPILPLEHVLTQQESHLLCAVDGKGAVACRIGDHGFVLTPTATTLF